MRDGCTADPKYLVMLDTAAAAGGGEATALSSGSSLRGGRGGIGSVPGGWPLRRALALM